MSLMQSTITFQNYLERLLKQATPSVNDVRYASYVGYTNEFLKFFGKEKCFLVGSSAEKTKLTWSKDDGDADFLFVSGKLSVPVDQLEVRRDIPSFVWVKGENLKAENSLGINLIKTDDGKTYLPAAILRDVDPRLFTFLRGIFKVVSRTTDSVPRESTMQRLTTTGESSKVGLERTQFKRLTIKDKDKIPQLRKYIPKKLSPRDHRTEDKHPGDQTAEALSRTFELFALFSTPGCVSEHQSKFDHFANVLKLLLNRQREERIKKRENEAVLMFEDADSDIYPVEEMTAEQTNENDIENNEDDEFERFDNDLDLPSDVKATYKEKFMTDFVPALRVEGKLQCMEEWYNRNGRWPPANVKKDIYDSECYVIAKNAPLDEDQRDFCLAFNHAELLLSKVLTPAQRKCFLLLKAYHKGIFEKTIANLHIRLPLKTFHIKTAFYWVLEETANTSIWGEENLIEAVSSVLQYLKEALLSKTLSHYFTPANLFVGFETSMCSALVGEIDTILKEPVESLQHFFYLENADVEITLTDEQVRCIIEMSSDGGVEKEADVLEDIMEDFKRGFREASLNEHGDVPLKEAMHHVMNIVLEDEAKRRTKNKLNEMNIPQAEKLAGILSKTFAGLVGSTVSTSASYLGASLIGSQCNSKSDNTESNDTSGATEDNYKETHSSIDSHLLQTHENVSDLDRSLSERAYLGRQLGDAASAFVFHPANKENRKSLEGEIKQKGLSYFLDMLD